MFSNVKVYDLEESVRASKFPMAADHTKVNGEITQRQRVLGQAKSGSGHDCFLKGILVSFDITCTNKMWVQLERYHFGDIVSSQSTMHRLLDMNLDEMMIEYVDPFILSRLQELQRVARITGQPEDKLKLLYSCPAGLKITARYTTNYLQLKTIYFQRRGHRLPEWKEFCDWCETLPHFLEFITK